MEWRIGSDISTVANMTSSVFECGIAAADIDELLKAFRAEVHLSRLSSMRLERRFGLKNGGTSHVSPDNIATLSLMRAVDL